MDGWMDCYVSLHQIKVYYQLKLITDNESNTIVYPNDHIDESEINHVCRFASIQPPHI